MPLRPLHLTHQRSRVGPLPRLPLQPDGDPFVAGFRRAAAGRTEFEIFARRLTDLEARVKAIPRLDCLRAEYGLYAEHLEAETLQVRFGHRRTFRLRKTEQGVEHLIETGPALVYSLGADGTIAVMLYGAKSEVSQPQEEVIFLALGRLGFTTLLDRVNGDLKTLAAYAHATSLDGTPTLGEWLRVEWLRRFHPHTTADGFQTAQWRPGAVGWFVTKTLVTAVFNALLRPLAVVFVIWWVVTYQADLAELLPKSIFK